MDISHVASLIFTGVNDGWSEKHAGDTTHALEQIVNHPEDVKVDRKIDEMGVLISLDVNAEDMGMIIGREGATAKAIRTLLRVVGMKNHARVNLKIEEPEGGRAPRAERKESSSSDIENISL